MTTEAEKIKNVSALIDGLSDDYGYCNCKRKHNDMHLDIVKDLEKLKLKIIMELRK